MYFRDSVLLLMVHCMLTVLEVAAVFGFVGFISNRTGIAPLQLLDKGENQMWHFLSYLSYISNTKLFSGIALFMCIFVLLNIFVSAFVSALVLFTYNLV